MQSWCFTFGCGSPLANCYVEIEAKSELLARLQMNAWFTRHWASVYPKEGFEQQAEQYGLVRIPVNMTASVRLMTNHDEFDQNIYRQLYG